MLWRKRNDLQKYHRAIAWLAPLLSAGASILGSVLGSKKKQEQVQYPQYTGPKSQLDVTGGQELLDQLMARKGASTRLRDVYYNDLYQPTANYVRGMRNEQIINPIMAQAGAMGMSRSSKVADDLANRITQQELGLGQYGGELKARGFETGLGEEKFGTSGLENFVGNEAELASTAAGLDYKRNVSQMLADRTISQENEGILPSIFATAGNLFPSVSPVVQSLLNSIGAGRTAIRGGVGGRVIPTTQFGNTWSPN